jgi:group II intron reverse transcriptase/maturase
MSLLDKIARKENLFKAWFLIKRKPKSFGIDQETIQSFQDKLYPRINSINSILRNRQFRFSRYRGHIYKERGKKPRPLLIPTVQDRIVQKATVNIIGGLFHMDFCDCSYGYIEGRKITDAVAAIINHKSKGCSFVLEADIKSFFDNVDRHKLSEVIMSKFKRDKSINWLLKDAIDAKIGNPEIFDYQDIEFLNNSEIGIPQGGILSPLFANIYLTYFDKRMLDSGFNLVRYADDFIVLCKTKKEALAAYSLSKELLENQLKLQLHPIDTKPGAKTRITDFKQGFHYLGIHFDQQGIAPGRTSIHGFRAKINQLTNYNQVTVLIDNLLRLSKLVLGWGNAYRFCKNKKTKEIFKNLDIFILKRVDTFLKRLNFLAKAHAMSNKQLKLLKIRKLTKLLT